MCWQERKEMRAVPLLGALALAICCIPQPTQRVQTNVHRQYLEIGKDEDG